MDIAKYMVTISSTKIERLPIKNDLYHTTLFTPIGLAFASPIDFYNIVTNSPDPLVTLKPSKLQLKM